MIVKIKISNKKTKKKKETLVGEKPKVKDNKVTINNNSEKFLNKKRSKTDKNKKKNK
jgi:hypothetical protein